MPAFQVSGDLSSTIYFTCDKAYDDNHEHDAKTEINFGMVHPRKRLIEADSLEEAVGMFIQKVLTDPHTGYFIDEVFCCNAVSPPDLIDQDDNGDEGLTLFYSSFLDAKEHKSVNMGCCETPPTTVWGEVGINAGTEHQEIPPFNRVAVLLIPE